MKGKIHRRSGFKPVLAYVFDMGKNATGKKQPEIVSSSMASEDPGDMLSEFRMTKELRPDITKPVWHTSLSIPAGERPLLSSQWNIIIEDFMRRMGFPSDTMYVAVRHKDTDHDHIHIVASRVSLGRKVYAGHNEVFRMIKITQDMEKDYGLTRTLGLESGERSMSMNERQLERKTGHMSKKHDLKVLIDKALSYTPTKAEFVRLLNSAGVRVFLNESRITGHICGASYMYKDSSFKGSQLGKKYGWQQLSGRLMMDVGDVVRNRHVERDARHRSERTR